MAKPPAIRPRSPASRSAVPQLGVPQSVVPRPAGVARARAAAQGAATRHPPRRQAPKTTGALRLFFFGLAFIGLATFAAPTCVLLLVGMVPSIVAYVVDRSERPMLAFTIAPVNLAGLMPYLLQLWTGRDTMPTVVHLLTDVYVWLVIYLSAGAGWLLFLGMPMIIAIVLGRSLDRRKSRLETLQSRLKADWGAEVANGKD